MIIVLVELALGKLKDYPAFQSGYGSPMEGTEHENKKLSVIRSTGVFIAVLGTIVWGYGDIFYLLLNPQ